MRIIVSEKDIRLDKYIADNTEISRSLATKMIDDKVVFVNNENKKSSYKVSEGDVIEFDENYQKEVELEKNEMSLDIVFEDEYLMVINKASGLVVHPGSGNKNNTLVNGLLHYTNDLSDEGGAARAGIVHRLDKDTSGLMLVAKTNKVHEILSEYFKNKDVNREYLAIIKGVFPSEKAKINAPIGKSSKNFRLQEVKDGGKNAVTNLTVEKRFGEYSLVRLSLETGRTHQIRVHLNYIGYPVVNDPVYGIGKSDSFGQYLHSAKLSFVHPITGKELSFEKDIPKEMKNFIKENTVV